MASRGRSGRGRSRREGTDADGWGEWGGYMEAKRQKLQDQFNGEAPPSGLSREGTSAGIFSGVSIHVNGYTDPSSDELKRLVISHGGHYEHYLYRTRVTHVIATNLTNSKIKDIRGLKVVRPEWITESVKCGKLLSYINYQIYTAKSGRQLGLSGFAKQDSTESAPSTSYHDDHLDDMLGINDLQESPEKDGPNLLDSDRGYENDKERCGLNSDTATPNIENRSRTKSGTKTNGHQSPAKAGDSRFLSEFYNNSRLHHLSTWKAELREYVNELQSKGDNFTGKENLRELVHQREIIGISQDSEVFKLSKGKPERCVMHIDMDCFFVSVGLRKRPHLKGKPVAVTHSKGKGATPTPGSDLDFERKQWELRGRNIGTKKPETRNVEENLKFPDQSDSDDDDAMETTAAFHSMASIASCSYEARKAGVKNGMLMGTAKSICPSLLTIPYDFEGYQEVSKCLYDTVASYTHDIEAVSCDEMLVDCTDLLATTGATPLEFATVLRQEILDKTCCNASAGLASNILLARMATRKAKPNGQFHLEAESVPSFITTQPIRDIPGVGWSLAKKFDSLNIATCGDLQKVSMETLQKQFGQKTGQSMYRYCRGQDDRAIKMEHQRKSVSAEVNYGIRFTCESEAVKFVEDVAEEACTRMRNIGMKGKSITLKLMIRRKDAPKETAKFLGHGICTHVSKSAMLPIATDEPRIVGRECLTILRQQKAPVEDLRGIGIQIQKLEPAKVGTKRNLSKNQSILNFAVSKTLDTSSMGSHCTEASESLTPKASLSRNGAKTSIEQSDSSIHITDQSHVTVDFTSNQSEYVLHTDQSNVVSVHNQSGDMLHENQSEETHIDQSVILLEPGISKTCSLEATPKSDICDINSNTISDEVQEQTQENNLLNDVARRQTDLLTLPPLPQWPDIKTPESNRKTHPGTSHTPEVAREISDGTPVDYFPSPSQVDPEVLKELPADIRAQVEKEIKSRLLRKQNSTRGQTRSSVGSDGESRGGACSNEGGVCSSKGGVMSDRKGDNSDHMEDKSKDPIVPLPSPSQLDVSCLNALPESMQNEIREAYAKRDSTSKDSHTRGGHSLNLQLTGSPSKLPSKRSPSKQRKSPNFKVPRGKPATRGRKKGSSKKLLFKDQPLIATKITPHVLETPWTSSDVIIIDNTQDTAAIAGVAIPADNEKPTCSTSKSNDHRSESVRSTDTASVSLCGAVTLYEVRSLIKEWIYSTVSPQQEDEQVLIDYLQNLVLDKNLELVDLVLKFLRRNVQRIERDDWLLSVQRIFTETQYIVKSMYGSTFASL